MKERTRKKLLIPFIHFLTLSPLTFLSLSVEKHVFSPEIKVSVDVSVLKRLCLSAMSRKTGVITMKKFWILVSRYQDGQHTAWDRNPYICCPRVGGEL